MKKILAILAVLFLLVGCVQVSVPENKCCVDKCPVASVIEQPKPVVQIAEKIVVIEKEVVVEKEVEKPTTVIIDKSHVHINNNDRDHVNINGNKIKSNNKKK